MNFKNIQHFIDFLEVNHELIRVREFVSPNFEMAEIADRVVKQGGKALLFENNGTRFPVLMNAMGTEKRMCIAMGVESLDDIGREIEHLFKMLSTPREGIWEKLKLLPSLGQMSSWFPHHRSGSGQCQEIRMEKPDLASLPVLTCWPFDGGPFITFPVVHTKDPETGMRNVGMYRMQVYGPDSTGMHWHLHKNSARHYHAYKKLKKRMPVTVTLGGDPVYTYAATAPLPDQVDEYLLAGFIRKRRVELVKCLTNELEVPEDVDFVIEGYVDPDEDLRVEGPFGDHTGFYSLTDLYPVFHITCITHRKSAVYPATVVGIPPQEDLYMGKATERIFLMPIRMSLVPEIIDMHMPAEGVFHNLVLVKINKTYPGQAVKVMNSLWGAGQMMFNKVMVVVDEGYGGDEGYEGYGGYGGDEGDEGYGGDESYEGYGGDKGDGVELRDYMAVYKAVMKNVVVGRDVYFSRGPVDVLDHASSAFAIGGKMGIDATKKLPQEKGEQKKQSEEMIHYSPGPIFNGKLQGIKIVPLAKSASGEIRKRAMEMMEKNMLNDVKILVFVEAFVQPDDLSTICWRVLNNIDPARDCYLQGEGKNTLLVIDGSRKYLKYDGFERRWPNCTVSNDETISKIDEIWDKLGLGPKLASPSMKYRNQVYPGEAEADE